MPLDSTPDVAQNIISFDGTAGRAARLNYSVPLPGRFVGKRAVVLDLGIADTSWSAAAKSAGANIAKAIGLERDDSGTTYVFNEAKAVELWLEYARAGGVPGDQVEAVEAFAAKADVEAFLRSGDELEHAPRMRAYRIIGGGAVGGGRRGDVYGGEELPPRSGPEDDLGVEGIVGTSFGGGEYGLQPAPDGPDVWPQNLPAIEQFKKYWLGLKRGVVVMPHGKWGGAVGSTPVSPQPQPQPMLMLIEVYGISSFLADYGLGRTVKTFTLLPGESTTISLKTWKSSEAKFAEGSTIIDSFQSTAADKFRTSVQRETTDRTLTDTTSSGTTINGTTIPARLESFGLDLFGVFKVNATGGTGTETHTTREDFSKTVGECVQEHSNEASAKRELTVTSSSELIEKSGEETVTERTIKNVNLRRVLNFVFRELNQEYVTKIHLKEIRVAFTNGRPFSYREVPLSGVRRLLQDVLIPSQVDSVAQQILKLASVVFDGSDTPIPVLETFSMATDGQSWTKANAALVGGAFPPPTDTLFYRFKRGALGQTGSDNPVPGVLLREERVTLRTDSVVVEALLGQADALDEYAMEVQRAEAEAKSLANDREKLAQQALQSITDPEERAESFAEMFNKPLGNGEVVIHTEPHG